MSALEQVVAQLHGVLAQTAQGRGALATATGLLSQTHALTRECLREATAEDAGMALAALSQARQDTEDLDAVVAGVEQRVTAYLRHIGAETNTDAVPNSSPPTRAPTASAQPVEPGLWNGLTATGHAREQGRGIGRTPTRPKRHPIREVRTQQELDALFTALSRGGTTQNKPHYAGSMIAFPDGTTVGYRVRSKTTVEPTIDITAPGGYRLKIHVNTQGWS